MLLQLKLKHISVYFEEIYQNKWYPIGKGQYPIGKGQYPINKKNFLGFICLNV